MTKERVGEEEEETPAPTLREMLKAVAGNAPLINLPCSPSFLYCLYRVDGDRYLLYQIYNW
jgi:GPH family glycoside/pentoside/hexuronide:cation symporter